jgi:hypothetical protein
MLLIDKKMTEICSLFGVRRHGKTISLELQDIKTLLIGENQFRRSGDKDFNDFDNFPCFITFVSGTCFPPLAMTSFSAKTTLKRINTLVTRL